MRALLYSEFGRVEVTDVPSPVPADGEVLVQVDACGLCGSELETFKNRSERRMPPVIMGHEFCGQVAAIGPGVDRGWVGKRVVSNSVVSCEGCVRCRRGDSHLCSGRQIFGMHRPGAFATLVSVPVRCLIDWPTGVPAAAACLAEPLANGVHILNLTHHLPAERALVIGAGPIGLMCQQVLQTLRSTKVIVADLNAARLAVAAKLGAVRTIAGGQEEIVRIVKEFTDNQGADLVIDAVGAGATKRTSLAACRPGGAAVWIGLHEDKLDLSSYDVILPERQIFGTYAAKIGELETALGLMRDGRVDVTSWVQTFSLERSVEAFHRMLAARGGDIKAVFSTASERETEGI